MVADEERNQGNGLHEDKWSIGLNVFYFVWEYLIFYQNNCSFRAIRLEVFQYSQELCHRRDTVTVNSIKFKEFV